MPITQVGRDSLITSTVYTQGTKGDINHEIYFFFLASMGSYIREDEQAIDLKANMIAV